MQIDVKKAKPELGHSIKKAIVTSVARAKDIFSVITEIDEHEIGIVSCILKRKKTEHTGETLICSTGSEIMKSIDPYSNSLHGSVDLYLVKPTSEFTELDWKRTGIGSKQRVRFDNWYGYFLRDPKKMVEMPFAGPHGMYDIAYDAQDLIYYPTSIAVSKHAFQKAIKHEEDRPKK